MSSSHLEHESFEKFFENWLSQQNQYLNDLHSMARAMGPSSNHAVDALTKRVMEHYEHYYEVKCNWVEQDALGMLKPSWVSTLEHAFLWLGGWRPTMAIHLLYSKSGFQLEGRLLDLIEGISRGDLADLSSDQLVRINTLQKVTIKKETKISEKMAKYQETIADPSMVELAQAATNQSSNMESGGSLITIEEKLKGALGTKEDDLKEIVKMADQLRIGTLKKVIGILTKSQGVHFLIAAAELHLRIHEWGFQRESDQSKGHQL